MARKWFQEEFRERDIDRQTGRHADRQTQIGRDRETETLKKTPKFPQPNTG